MMYGNRCRERMSLEIVSPYVFFGVISAHSGRLSVPETKAQSTKHNSNYLCVCATPQRRAPAQRVTMQSNVRENEIPTDAVRIHLRGPQTQVLMPASFAFLRAPLPLPPPPPPPPTPTPTPPPPPPVAAARAESTASSTLVPLLPPPVPPPRCDLRWFRSVPEFANVAWHSSHE